MSAIVSLVRVIGKSKSGFMKLVDPLQEANSSGAVLGKSKSAIFFDFILIVTGEPIELQKLYNHLKIAENIFFLHIVANHL